MCVIAFSPKGVKAPTEEQIRDMFKQNPDGAGFAYQEKGVVHYKKGFMDVESLLKELKPLEQWEDKIFCMHFRIGTAGNNDKPTTHPFPLSSHYADLRQLEGEGPVLFHNGVFSDFGGIIDPKSSDTQDFVSGVAAKLLINPRTPSKATKKAIEALIGTSRVLIMYGKDKIASYGKWDMLDGNYYSNMLWQNKYKIPKGTFDYYDYYGKYSAYASAFEDQYFLDIDEANDFINRPQMTLVGNYTFMNKVNGAVYLIDSDELIAEYVGQYMQLRSKCKEQKTYDITELEADLLKTSSFPHEYEMVLSAYQYPAFTEEVVEGQKITTLTLYGCSEEELEFLDNCTDKVVEEKK